MSDGGLGDPVDDPILVIGGDLGRSQANSLDDTIPEVVDNQAQIDLDPDHGGVETRGRPMVDGNKIYYEYDTEGVGEWECGQCPEAFPDVNNLEAHYRGTHNEWVVRFICSKCERSFTSYGVISHYAKCKGRQIRPDPEEKPYGCTACDFKAGSKIGLGQHERHRHPELRNSKRIAQRTQDVLRKRLVRWVEGAPGKGSKLWSGEDDVKLVELCIAHEGARYINKTIEGTGLLPGKTAAQISERRRRLGGTKQARERMREATAVSRDQPADTVDPAVLPTRRCLVELDNYLKEMSGVAAKSDIGTSIWEGLCDHVNGQDLRKEHMNEITTKIINELGKASPRTKRTGNANRRRSQKVNANGAAAAEYSRIQRLYASKRKTLVKEILDGKKDNECPLDVREVERTYQGRFGLVD
jgi:hypothetical protein